MYCLLLAGTIVYGYHEMPAQMNGAYTHSCGTSYCRGASVHCTPQASVKSILNRPSGPGYSVKYNYGLEPDYVAASTWSGGSGSYNYGMK